MLGHAPRDMRVMMLHRNQLQASFAGPLPGPRGGKITRVHVVHHSLRLNFECVHQMRQRLAKKFETAHGLQIAEMLALIRVPPTCKRENILQMAAYGKKRWSVEWQLHAVRHKSSCPAN